MIVFKIIIILLYLIFLSQSILINAFQVNLPILNKRNKFVDLSRFFSRFGVFLEMSDQFRDIKLVATTRKIKKIWYLRIDKKIGDLYLGPHFIRQHLAFNYTAHQFDRFMNDYFRKKIQTYYTNMDDELISFQIFSSLYSSFEKDEIIKNRSKPIKEELIFHWVIDERFYDKRFRYI